MADIKDFLSPTGTLTPGIAGGLASAIAFPVALNFQISVKWTALVLSFLLGAVIVLSFKDPISRVLQFVYWVLDSLIIFSTVLGVGTHIDPPPTPPPTPAEIQRLFGDALVGPRLALSGVAFAQGVAQPTPPTSAPTKGSPRPAPDQPRPVPTEKELTKEQREAVKKYLEQQKQYQLKQEEYSKRWSW